MLRLAANSIALSTILLISFPSSVSSGISNVAQWKPTSSLTLTRNSAGADTAVDGSHSCRFSGRVFSCYISKTQPNSVQWWQVDLEALYYIIQIKLFPGGEFQPELTILISEDPEGMDPSPEIRGWNRVYYSGLAKGNIDISLQPTRLAQYIAVHSRLNELVPIMSLREVEVFGYGVAAFKPSNLHIFNKTSECLTLVWEPPDQNMDVVTEYEYQCGESNFISVENRKLATQCGLSENTTVNCAVRVTGSAEVATVTTSTEKKVCHSCSEPPIVENAQVIGSISRICANSNVTYHCGDGYTGNISVLTCERRENKLVYIGETPTCNPLPPSDKVCHSCSEPPIVENAQVIGNISRICANSSVTYRCDDGYTGNVSVLTCEKRENKLVYIGETPTCNPQPTSDEVCHSCSEPPIVENAQVIGNISRICANSSVTYRCDDGYTGNVSVLECEWRDNTLVYIGETPTCNPQPTSDEVCHSCSELPIVENAQVIGNISRICANSSVTYRCGDGYTGNISVLTCEWRENTLVYIGETPTCNPEPTSNKAQLIAIVVPSVGSILVIATILIIVLKRRECTRKNCDAMEMPIYRRDELDNSGTPDTDSEDHAARINHVYDSIADMNIAGQYIIGASFEEPNEEAAEIPTGTI